MWKLQGDGGTQPRPHVILRTSLAIATEDQNSERGLEGVRAAARNVHSDSQSETSPSPTTVAGPWHLIPRTFKIIAFDHQPEFFCSSMREGAALDACLELIDPGSVLANSAGMDILLRNKVCPSLTSSMFYGLPHGSRVLGDNMWSSKRR